MAVLLVESVRKFSRPSRLRRSEPWHQENMPLRENKKWLTNSTRKHTVCSGIMPLSRAGLGSLECEGRREDYVLDPRVESGTRLGLKERRRGAAMLVRSPLLEGEGRELAGPIFPGPIFTDAIRGLARSGSTLAASASSSMKLSM